MDYAKVLELMKLRGWSKTDLACHLQVTESAVYKWCKTGIVPTGPTSILLSNWLAESKTGKPKRKRAVAVA